MGPSSDRSDMQMGRENMVCALVIIEFIVYEYQDSKWLT